MKLQDRKMLYFILKHLMLVILGVILWKCYNYTQNLDPPSLDANPWWGPEHDGKDDRNIRKFNINVPTKDIEDLKKRLSLPLRLTPPLQNANFTYGFNSEVLKNILNYWHTKYDWKRREQKLNSFPQFITQIEGLDIHFIRMKPNIPAKFQPVTVRPLLLIHGWPGSVFEFDEILPLLTSPHDGSDVVFEVICPSIPGYAFSKAPSKQGFGGLQTAQIFLKLMKRLGFDKFYVQGGDWGFMLASYMTTMYPKNVYGMHANMVIVNTPGTNIKHILGAILPSGFINRRDDEHYLYPMSDIFGRLLRETGHAHIQATKPDTIGAALSNSPAGLAAYILEKFSTWTHKENPSKPDGGLLSEDFPISLDRLLDNLSIYWFTQSITSSMRFYRECIDFPTMMYMDRLTTDIPVGFSAFAHELLNLPENLAAHKYTRIVAFRKHDIGGHFAAMEQPSILAKDIYDFAMETENILNLRRDFKI